VYRGHMGISSWGGKMRERFETVLGGHYKGWKGVKFLEENWVAAGKAMDEVMRGWDGGKVVGALATANGLPEEEGKKAQAAKGGAKVEEKVAEPLELSQTESVAISPPTAVSIKEEVEPSAPSHQPKLVYLSSDSPNTLTTLSPYTTYVIGGIVDKNRYKGLCYKRACEAGIPTAKLPIGEYMEMQSRSVLTVNHVMEIMIRWLETGDWGEAFLKVIPKRKEAKLRGKGRGRDKEENGEEEAKDAEDGDDGEGQRDGSESESDDEGDEGDDRDGAPLETEPVDDEPDEKATGVDTAMSGEQPEAVET
jgi:tRNA (guanine9-N1)-methyltransferase